MIPHASQAIKDLSQKLLTQVLPHLANTYVMSDAAMMAMLMNALAEEAESGVAKRLSDIEEMTGLFDKAVALGVKVPEISAAPRDMTLTSVNETHDACTRALIDLHVRIETDDQLKELNASIWGYLTNTHERHALSI